METLPKGQNNKLFHIRQAKAIDAKELLQISRSVMAEGLYLSSDPDEFTITYDQEQTWIKDHIKSPGKLLYVAVVNDKVVGFLNFANGKQRRNQHVGEMAITIAKPYRNVGIGSALIKVLIEWAEQHPIIEKINLIVFHNNKRAIHVYEKLGFIKEGIQKGENKLPDGTYLDDILMAYWVRK